MNKISSRDSELKLQHLGIQEQDRDLKFQFILISNTVQAFLCRTLLVLMETLHAEYGYLPELSSESVAQNSEIPAISGPENLQISILW